MIKILLNQPLLSYKDKRIYRIANFLMILAILVVGGTGIFFLVINSFIPFWICFGETTIFLLLLYWHTHGRKALARYVFFIFSICMTSVGSLLHGESSGFDFLLFVTALAPVLFFNKQWQYTSLFILSMATYIGIKNLYAEIPALLPIQKAVVPYYLNITMSGILMYFGYSLFKAMHLTHEKKLKEKNRIIQEQKESLTLIKDQLEELLKLRTAKIKEQHNDFIKYAFLNSHKVRSPLARILGLVNLTSFEDFSDEKKRDYYFAQIKKNITELDDILKEVSHMLNGNMEEE